MIAVFMSLPTLIMGVIPLIIGLHSYKKGKKYDSESKVIVGEIVDIRKGERIVDTPPGWFPTVRYWDERTNSYLLYESTTGGSFKSSHTIGDKYELRYLYTDKGVDIRANASIAIYGISKHCIVIGSILTSIGIMILVTLSIFS